MKAFARQSLRAAVWLAGALLLPACQSQSAGERCDNQNGAADCASGLICGAGNTCCVPGTAACNAITPPSTSDAATSTPDGDAASEGSETMTGEATTKDAATNDAAINDVGAGEAATMNGETGVEASIVTDAADGAAE